MGMITSIRNLFKRGSSVDASGKDREKKADTSGNAVKNDQSMASAPGFEFLDGMSTGTARFIIEREVDSSVLEKYNIKDLENKGRYYLAKIVNQEGEVVDTVLIDKLNRSIHFQKGRLK